MSPLLTFPFPPQSSLRRGPVHSLLLVESPVSCASFLAGRDGPEERHSKMAQPSHLLQAQITHVCLVGCSPAATGPGADFLVKAPYLDPLSLS